MDLRSLPVRLRDFDDPLFHEGDLSALLRSRASEMVSAIDGFDESRFLNTDSDDLAKYFVASASLDVVGLCDDDATLDHRDVKIDMTGHREYDHGFNDGPVLVAGVEYTLFVPFSGDPTLFKYRPSRFTMSPPRAKVQSNEVVIMHRAVAGTDAGEIKKALDGVVTSIREHLAFAKNDINEHNSKLLSVARHAIEARRTRTLKKLGNVTALGYPLRRRDGVPATFAVPSVRRKIAPTLPPPRATRPFVPEPTLDSANYEHILSVLGNMVHVMEKSPSAFSTMKEEDLRTHFLVQLNGHFEGAATGETFHGSGSTDILLPTDGKQVFIAECKFWDGPSTIRECIEQLLDYATWRDAKTAILIFNRRRDLSAVLKQIPRAIEQHEDTASPIQCLRDTDFRFQLRLRDDKERMITVTLMVFDVPTERKVSKRLKPKGEGK